MQNNVIRKTLDVFLAFIVGMSTIMLIIWFALYNAEKIKYDCSIAEISPDIPLEVKEECQNLLRAHNL